MISRETLVDLLHRRDMSYREAAQVLSCSYGMVQYWAKKHGVRGRGRRLKNPGVAISRPVIENLLVDRGMSVEEAADVLSVHKSDIVFWARKNDIPILSPRRLSMLNTDTRVLKFVANHPGSFPREIVKATGIPMTSVRSSLTRLIRSGKLAFGYVVT